MTSSDTIAAIATPPGRGGIGVIRISGTDLKVFGKTLLGELPIPRQAMFKSFLDTEGRAIDQGIALFFPCTLFIYWRRCTGITRAWWSGNTEFTSKPMPYRRRTLGPAR